MSESSEDSIAEKPHSDPRTESCQSGRKSSSGGASGSVADSKKNGAVGDGIADVLQSTTSSVVQVGTLPHFLDQ